MDNHYSVLNVALGAPDAVVRAAYRVLAAQFHPDRRGDAAALRHMQRVNEAYRVLADPRLRAEHDAQLRRQHRRRAGDGGAPHRATAGTHTAMEDIVADAERQRTLALARRRAMVAGTYANHAALG